MFCLKAHMHFLFLWSDLQPDRILLAGRTCMDEREIIQKTLDDHPDLDPALRSLLEDKLDPSPLVPKDEDDDQILILCGYWPSIINGSKLVFCAECKTRCCIAPSTQEKLKGQTAKIRMLCVACFEKDPPEEAAEMLKLLKAAQKKGESKGAKEAKARPINPFLSH